MNGPEGCLRHVDGSDLPSVIAGDIAALYISRRL